MKLFTFASKCKGSISLFLTIILLPTLTFTGLMVDSANIALSKTVVENAGELATNAALANYDTLLRDVYGLLAMSQSATDSAEAEKYFKNTMEATSMLESVKTALSGLNQNIKDWLGVKEASEQYDVNTNFLNISYDSFEIKGVPGSTLRNHQILKNQLVEFMKYRGPAEIALDMFTALNGFDSQEDKIAVTTEKTEVDAAKADLGEICQTLYKAIVELDARTKAFKEAEKVWRDGCENLNDTLYIVNQLEIQYLYNAPDFSKFKYIEYDSTVENSTSKKQRYKMDSKLVTEKISSDWVELLDQYAEYYKRMQNIDYQAIYTFQEATKSSNAKKLREYYEYYLNYLVDLETFVAIYKQIVTLTNKDSYTFAIEKGNYATDEEFKAAVAEERETRKAWIKSDIEDIALKQIAALTNSIKDGIAAYDSQIETYRTVATNYYSEVQTTFNNYYVSLEKLIGCKLKNGEFVPHEPYFLIRSGTYKQVTAYSNNYLYLKILCDKVKEKVKAMQTENQQLIDKTEEYGKEVGKDELYNEMKSEAELNKVTFTSEEVDELVAQIDANSNYVWTGIAYDTYTKYTLYKKTLGSMPKLEDLEKQMRAVEAELGKQFDPTKHSEYFDTYFPKKFSSQASSFTKTKYIKMISEGGVQAGGTVINVPKLYITLLTLYGSYKEEDANKNADDRAKDIQGMVGQAKDQITKEDYDVEYDVSVFDSLTSDGKALSGSNDIKDLEGKTAILRQFASMSRTVKGMFGVFKNGLSGLVDNLLVSEYVFQNFSHATTPKLAKDPKNPHRMTTTNVEINPNNNRIYGCEIEYILEGYRGKADKKHKFLGITWWTTEGDGPEKNITIVKTNIFMIRFVLNCIFALANGSLRTQLQAPAAALSAACLGFVPQPVWVVILQLTLALAESIYDLNHLMKGEEIPLFKSNKTWVFQLSGLADVLVEEAGDFVTDKLKEGADKALAKVDSTLESIISQVGDKVEGKVEGVLTDVSKELMELVTEQVDDAVASLSEVIKDYVEKTYMDIACGLLQFDAKQFGEGLQAVIDQYCQNSDNKIVQLIAEQGPGLIDQLVNDKSVGKALQDVADKAKVNIDLGDNLNTNFELSTVMLGEILNGTTEKITEFFDNIRQELVDKAMEKYVGPLIDEAEDELNALVDKGHEKAGEWTDEMSEKLGEKVDSWFGNTFGSYTSGGNSGGLGSSSGSSNIISKIVNFSYADYLRLFLILGLCDSSSAPGILSRIADVIELNINGALKDYYKSEGITGHIVGKKFSMANAYTYVEMNAHIKVKPLLLSQTIFGDGSAIDFWGYDYSNAQGY